MKIILPDYKKIASEIEKKEIQVTKEEIENLKLEKERQEKEKTRQEILEKIAQNTTAEIPENWIEEEKNQMLENLKKTVPATLQISFGDYLTKIKKTEKEIAEAFLPEAEKRIKKFLLLKEISKKEGIEVPEEELKAEMDRVLKFSNLDYNSPTTQQKLDLEKLREYAKEVIRNEKTFQFLESFTKK